MLVKKNLKKDFKIIVSKKRNYIFFVELYFGIIFW